MTGERILSNLWFDQLLIKFTNIENEYLCININDKLKLAQFYANYYISNSNVTLPEMPKNLKNFTVVIGFFL